MNPEIRNGIRMVRFEKNPISVVFEGLGTFDVVTVKVNESGAEGILDRYAPIKDETDLCGVLSLRCHFGPGRSDEEVARISWAIAGALFRISADT